MKSIFYSNNVSYAYNAKYICNKLNHISTVSDVYYNHLFSSFFIEYEDESEIMDFFINNHINVIKLNSINEVIQNISKNKNKLKYKSIILLILFIIQIINLFININDSYQLLIGLIITLISLYLNKDYLNVNVFNDSFMFIVLIVLSLLFISINLQISLTLITFILCSITIYKYILVLLKSKLFKKEENTETKALIKRNNVQLEVKPHEIKPNDIVIVKDQYTLPVDGVIIDGFTQVDQSMYTSEIPVANKTKHQNVIAGMINQSGYMEYRATSTNDENTINKRNNLILDAISSKNNLGNSLIFLHTYYPKIMIGTSIILFLVLLIKSQNILASVSFLISLLALINFEIFEFITPLNVYKTIIELSKDGIFVKNSNTIEKINDCEIVMIEKVVLIEDEPDVKDVFISEGIIPSDFYHVAYILTKNSKTKYASTIRNYLKNVHISEVDPKQFQNTTRKPIAKEEIFKNYRFSTYEQLKNKNFNLSKVEPSIQRFLSQGKNSIMFTYKDKIIGILTIQDILKDNVTSTIESLIKLNKRIILLDKGQPEITKHYAKKLNVAEYHCNLTNLQKSKLVASLYSEGLKTVYISNPIKKIPENTEVNISINSGINFDIHNADVIVVKPNIDDVLKLMNKSKDTIFTINNQISLFIQIYGSLVLLSFLSFITYITPYLNITIIYLLTINLIKKYKTINS